MSMSSDVDRDFARLEAGEAPTQPPSPAPPAAPSPRPILTMTTLLPDRDWLTIDGKRYDLARYHDLSLHQHAKFSRRYIRALDAYGKILDDRDDALSEQQAQALEEEAGQNFLDAMTLIVRKCPRAILAQLAVESRMQVCSAFQQAVTRWRAGLASPPPADQPTGDASSTPSPPDSDADPAGGSDGPASENSLAPTGD
jgi:hypothetical protein